MVGSGIAGMFRVNVENELAGHGGPGSPQFVLRRDIHSALQGDIAAAKHLFLHETLVVLKLWRYIQSPKMLPLLLSW